MNTLFLLFFVAIISICQAQEATTLSYTEIDSLLYLEYDKDNIEGCIHYMELGRNKAKTEFGDVDTTYALYTSDLAYFYWQQKEYKKAEPLYLEAQKIRAKVWGIEHDDYGTTLNNLAMLYKDMGDIAKAESLYIEAKTIKEKASGKNSTAYFAALNNMVLFYQELGNNSKVEQLYKETIEIKAKGVGKEHPDYIGSLNTLAQFYIKTEQYLKAEPLLQEANQIIKKVQTEEHFDYVISLNSLANLYVLMEEFELAESTYLNAKKTCEKNRATEHIEYYRTLNNLTKLYPLMKDYNKAESAHIQLLEIWKAVLTKDNPNYINTLDGLAKVYKNKGQLEQADTLFLEVSALKTQAFGKEHYEYLSSLLNLVDLYSKMGDGYNSKQEKLLLEIVGLSQKITDQNNDKNLYLNKLASFYYQQKNPILAWNYLQQALGQSFDIEVSSTWIDSFKIESFKVVDNYLNSLKIAYQLSELEQKKDTQVKLVEIAEKLLQKCASAKFSSKEKTQLLSKTANWTQYRFQLNNYQNQPEKLFQSAAFYKNSSIQNALSKEDALIAFAKDFGSKNNLIEIQKHLKEKALLLEYVIGDSSVWVLLITKQKSSVKTLNISKPELQKRVSSLHNILTNRQGEKAYSEQAFWFYQNLLEPVLDTSYRHLIIIPDRELAALPFECFITKAAEGNSNFKNLDYLIKSYSVSYAPSTSSWLFFKEKSTAKTGKSNGQILGLAADYTLQLDSSKMSWRLPAYQRWRATIKPSEVAQKEVAFLEKNYQGFFAYNKDASEKTFKEKASNYSIIHLAMQGVLNEKTNSLFFSEDGDSLENNLLSVEDILNSKLNSDLVVLSSCESQQGVLELSSAFMYAGASSLIVSLWQTDNLETIELIKNLYQNLANGMEKDEALRQAKIKYIEEAKGVLAHPAFWSAFVLIGDTNIIKLDTKFRISTRWFVGGFALSLIIFWILRKKFLHKKTYN